MTEEELRKIKWIFKSMRQRCYNPKSKDYPDYGGRGITVCPQWRYFEGFLKDMGSSYILGFSIERIDVNLGYSPSNCKWIDKRFQAQNKRVYAKNSSGTPGITWHSRDQKWSVKKRIGGKEHYIGTFACLADAQKALADWEYWVGQGLRALYISSI